MSHSSHDLPDRLIEAAYAVFAEKGVASGTMKDVARRAGVGRATLYRYHPGKDALVLAVALREARRLFVLLDSELGAEEDPASLLERGLLAALEHLRSHALLQRILETEPASILPFLTVRGAPLLEAAVDFATPYIERAVKAEKLPPTEPRLAAEWAARILLSLVLTPSVVVDLDDGEQRRAYVGQIIRGIFGRRGGT